MELIKFGEFDKKINFTSCVMTFRANMLLEEKVRFLEKGISKVYLMPIWANDDNTMICFTEDKYDASKLMNVLNSSEPELVHTTNQHNKRGSFYGLGKVRYQCNKSFMSKQMLVAYKYINGKYEYYYIYHNEITKSIQTCIHLELTISHILVLGPYSSDLGYKDTNDYKPRSIGSSNSRNYVGNSKRKTVFDLMDVSSTLITGLGEQGIVLLNLIPNILFKKVNSYPISLDIIPFECLVSYDRIKRTITYDGYDANGKKKKNNVMAGSDYRVPETKDKTIMTAIINSRMTGVYNFSKVIDAIFVSDITLEEVIDNFEKNKQTTERDVYERDMQRITNTLCVIENSIESNTKKLEMLSLQNKGKIPVPYIILPKDKTINYDFDTIEEYGMKVVYIYNRRSGSAKCRLGKLIDIKDNCVYLDITKGELS